MAKDFSFLTTLFTENSLELTLLTFIKQRLIDSFTRELQIRYQNSQKMPKYPYHLILVT